MDTWIRITVGHDIKQGHRKVGHGHVNIGQRQVYIISDMDNDMGKDTDKDRQVDMTSDMAPPPSLSLPPLITSSGFKTQFKVFTPMKN